MRRRSGVTLFWLVVLFAIVASLLALSYPALMTYEESVRVAKTHDMLETLRLSIYDGTAAATDRVFNQRVGNNPGRLSQLFTPIERNDAANFPDACSTSFSNGDRTGWRNWGPFTGFTFDPAVGLPTPMGTLNENLIRTAGVTTYLSISMDNADLNEITLLDQFDDNDGASAGFVRWDNISAGTARLLYTFAIDGSC